MKKKFWLKPQSSMELNGNRKATHEEHLDVYNFKKKERKKEVQALEQEKGISDSGENEGLTSQIAEARQILKLGRRKKFSSER